MDLLALLATLADGETHSGERLAADAGLTRAAVWKSIKRLDQWGLRVEAVSGRGYRLEQPIEWLEESLLRRQIDSDERFTLDGLDVFTEIDSTNRWLAHNPPARPGVLRVCVAEWQSAGRGRRERRWVSPLGSGICLSAAWVYEGVPRDISALSLAAGVATAHVIRRQCDVGPQLKWPNDIIWNSRKLGGLLVESSIESQGRCTVVVGVGLNVATPARVLAQASDWDAGAVDLRTARNGLQPDRNALVASLACELGALLADFERRGAAAWLQRWRSLDYLRGKVVRVGPESAMIEGVAAGIDDDGALLVTLGAGDTRRVVAGDASVRPR